MKIKINIPYLQAIATLVGTIVGAGIIGIPYAISRFGFWPGFIMIILLGLAIMVVNLMMGEIILRSRIRHQLMGYAKKYVGKWAGVAEGFSMLFANFGALVAYVIGIGLAVQAIIGGNSFWYSLIFAGIGALFIWLGLKIVKAAELIMMVLLLLAIIIITILIFPNIDYQNFSSMDLGQFFVPYGVLLFAYGGIYSIYSVRKILDKDRKKIKGAIIWACIIPIVLYVFFAFLIVGLTGMDTTEIATVGLGEALGPNILLWANLFAILSMFTSFLAIGVATFQLFRYDFKLNRIYSWLIVSFVPLVIFLLGNRFFIKTITIVGSVAVGLTGVIMILTYWKAKKSKERKPEYNLPKFKVLGWALISLFILGIIVTLIEEFIL